MRQKHGILFLLGLIFVFALFFLYLVYDQKYHVFYPKPPVVLSLIPASDSSSYPGIYQFDFENINDNRIVVNELAFSGKHALKVAGRRSYSPAVQIPLNDQLQKSQSALFGAWLFVGDSSGDLEGKLIFQIVDRSNKLKFSAASEIKEGNNKSRQWFYACGIADWKDTKILPTDFVKIYYWNNCKNTVFVDNVQVIFGKQLIKGEKPLADNTSHQFQFIQAADRPPYPSVFFEKEFSGNVKNTTIYTTDGKDALKMNNEDEFVSGRFVKGSNNIDQLLVVRNSKPFALVWYDRLKYQFMFQRCSGESDKRLSLKFPYTVADVNGDGLDELITCTPLSVINIFKFQFQTRSFGPVFSGTPEGLTPDVFFDQITGISKKGVKEKCMMVLDKKGNIILIKYRNDKLIASNMGMYKEVSDNKYACKIICGNFFKNDKNENLLLLYSEQKTGRCFYKMFEVDQEESGLHRLFDGNFENKCDTLRPDNSYFTCDFNNDKIDELISFSNGWRYDAKLVSFTKEGYAILANIDFTGYPKDFNPKYFEKQAMVPGNYNGNGSPTIFTFCGSDKRNPVSSGDMTPYIGIFSFKNNK